MIKLEELKNKGFKIKKRRVKTLDGLNIVEIIAKLEKTGTYTKTFAYDGEKLYKVSFEIEEIPTKWGIKTKIKYRTKNEIIETIEDLCKLFKEDYNIVSFEFEKYLKSA